MDDEKRILYNQEWGLRTGVRKQRLFPHSRNEPLLVQHR